MARCIFCNTQRALPVVYGGIKFTVCAKCIQKDAVHKPGNAEKLAAMIPVVPVKTRKKSGPKKKIVSKTKS